MYKFGCDCTTYLNFSTLIIRCQRVYNILQRSNNKGLREGVSQLTKKFDYFARN